MKFFEDVGKVALGSRVRFLAEAITQDAALIYKAYGTNLNPKWFPVFYILSKNKTGTVTTIAADIGHSHVSVIKILREMTRAGLITESPDPTDRRRTNLALSKTGRTIARKIEAQYTDVNAAIEEVAKESTHDLWAALAQWESLLQKKSLLNRVLDKKQRRESPEIKIAPYQPKYKEAFRKLNEEWITTYFKLEKPDREAIENPKKYILDRGGFIFVALLNNKPVGVCAMLKRDDQYDYELAKMAVTPKAQGKNIGYLLGQAVVDKAVSLNAKRIFLESNTSLTPALRLYEKLGFKKIIGPPTPYARCNIQMELKLPS